MSRFDTIIVGSGINSLVCAGVMAKRGKKVLVLEREDVLGGCIRTEALTAPGFLHDTLSTAHPLFVTSPGYAELKDQLHANGLAYGNNATPTGVLFPDGRSLVMSTSREANTRAMNALAAGDGDAYAEAMGFVEKNAELIFALLGNELWSSQIGKMMLGRVWKQGAHETMAFFGPAMQSCRAWLDSRFSSELVKGLLAPWVLHTGLGPESAMSALMAQVVAFTLEAVGLPIVKGGNARTVDAFRAHIEACGGAFVTGADVEEILVDGGKARGVRLADGRSFEARQVIANVTPTQLYGRLLKNGAAPEPLRRQAAQYRYGKGNMQIHIALSAPPEWPEAHLREVIYLHLGDGLDGVSRAVSEAERGLLPAAGTICVAQPCAVDPSRAPAGQWVLWVQLPECPRHIKGDALGEIPAPADGRWNADVAERYADRIVARIARQVPNLQSSILGRKVISPADLEAMNINLVGGDPYSGECSIDQYMFWRPLRGVKDHATPVKNLYQIGASTHPGPGLSGASGFHVANALAKR
ncbi:phytoene desaturase family protein [Cognatazoarcus halotolerans]|uniref:phytoene desaturase family protein n=1 Tax=Cognatazoarcus halotolerans TaxID=2686016 RepID=UPI00135BDD11|nr:NAD(P)/FAD-dependent oxidoreductase [Cognatazoarcus halotolerans]MCB1901479.1 NAD(P)/FAD-dependent oxidoreductase [Rhodocyclaceae bacterium]